VAENIGCHSGLIRHKPGDNSTTPGSCNCFTTLDRFKQGRKSGFGFDHLYAAHINLSK